MSHKFEPYTGRAEARKASNHRRAANLAACLAVLFLTATPARPQTAKLTAAPPPKVLWFRIDLHGLSPAALTIPEGDYLLRISKGVVVSDVDLQIEEANSKAVQNKGNAKARSSGTDLAVSLRAGAYTLLVPGVPKWSCQVTVTKDK